VPPFGPKKCSVALIGEGPGAVEVLKHKPFVGRSGKLLRMALRKLGYRDDTFYYSNVCKCRPKGNRKPTIKEARACGVTLEQEIVEHGVDTIITLGNVPLKFFFPKARGITRERGIVRKYKGWTLVPVFHPAYILRRYDLWPDFINDLEVALSLTSVTQPDEGEGEDENKNEGENEDFAISVITNPIKAARFFKHLRQFKFVYFDIETTGLKVRDDSILCISFSTDTNSAVVVDSSALTNASLLELRKTAQYAPLKWGGHNTQFDVSRCYSMLNVHPVISEDSMLLSYALDERGRIHGLKGLVQRILHFPDWEIDVKKYVKEPDSREYSALPKNLLWHYNALDTIYGYKLWEHLRPQVAADEDLERMYTTLLIPSANAIVDMTVDGVYIDEVKRSSLYNKLMRDNYYLTLIMRDMTNRPKYNPRSFKQTQEILYEFYEAPTFSHSKPIPKEDITAMAASVKENTTAKAQLQRLAHWNYSCKEFAGLLLRYRENQQLARTYLRNYTPESDGMIHPGYLIHGTVTGRWSSSKPNVFNMKRGGPLRSLVIPTANHILVSIDYSGAELRTGAALANSKVLSAAFKAGEDVHALIGKVIFGDEYNNATQRVFAKSVNFGTFYGAGPYKLAEVLGISVEQALEVQQRVKDKLGVREWIEREQLLARKQGYVTTPTGRRRRFPYIDYDNLAEILRQAVNAPVQGTSSDLTTLSLIEVNKWIHDYDSWIYFPTYDSILLNVHKDYLDEVVQRVTETMLEIPRVMFNDAIPFEVDTEVGYNYSKTEMKKWRPCSDDE